MPQKQAIIHFMNGAYTKVRYDREVFSEAYVNFVALLNGRTDFRDQDSTVTILRVFHKNITYIEYEVSAELSGE